MKKALEIIWNGFQCLLEYKCGASSYSGILQAL